MTRLAQYQRQKRELLADTAADLVFVGGLDVLQNTDLADQPAHTFADIQQCLKANPTAQNPLSVMACIHAPDLDVLHQQIGQLCQLFPTQVLLELQHKPGDKSAAQAFRNACFASGFRQSLHLVSDDVEYQLYEYRLKNYKQAPDWLNARFWAHPERFNVSD